jgi:hypothetical protein
MMQPSGKPISTKPTESIEERKYPTNAQAVKDGLFIDATSDDIDFDSPDGSQENPYPAKG